MRDSNHSGSRLAVWRRGAPLSSGNGQGVPCSLALVRERWECDTCVLTGRRGLFGTLLKRYLKPGGSGIFLVDIHCYDPPEWCALARSRMLPLRNQSHHKVAQRRLGNYPPSISVFCAACLYRTRSRFRREGRRGCALSALLWQTEALHCVLPVAMLPWRVASTAHMLHAVPWRPCCHRFQPCKAAALWRVLHKVSWQRASTLQPSPQAAKTSQRRATKHQAQALSGAGRGSYSRRSPWRR